MENARPLYLIVSGSAGSGKSFLIHMIKKGLGDRALIVAPTGVSALNVDGKTIHAGLKIPIFPSTRKPTVTKMDKLESCQIVDLSNDLHAVTHVIIDEFSMVGLRFLTHIDERLKEILYWNKNYPFGGLSVVMFGDLAQLPPVYDTVLWGPKFVECVQGEAKSDSQIKRGSRLYNLFERACGLNIPQRQNKEGDFFKLLMNLRNGTLSDDDHAALVSRQKKNLQPEEISKFSDSIHLFQTNFKVEMHNKEKLMRLGEEIIKIPARKFRPDVVYSKLIAPDLHLSKNARVMLTRNIWIDGGLFNGALGTVKDIVLYEDYTFVVFVEFDKYNGKCMKNGSIPITAVKFNKFDKFSNKFYNFEQIPLKVAYGATIHKSQGLTLPSIAVNVGHMDLAHGQSYVALSRVKSIQDLMILDENISKDRFSYKSSIREARLAEEARLFLMDRFEYV